MNRGKANFTFSQVPSVVRPRSVFDRSRTYKTTFDEGYLIPFYWDEILPGDTIANLSVTSFARLATLIVPFMDNLWMDFFFFFIPNRLVWENWQRFCGEQDNPDDSTDYLVPQVEVTPAVGSLYDYLGLPVGKSMVVDNLLPRAYNLVWNEFFRDENIQNSVVVDTDDGPDTASDYVLLKRGKRKSDPFTSALPWPQKGPGVELPIAGYAPVGYQGASGAFYGIGNTPGFTLGTTLDNQLNTISSPDSALVKKAIVSDTASTIAVKSTLGADTTFAPLVADLTATVAPTINTLREAFQIQKWYEELARGGSRYVELVLSMFGVHTGDARLQRPEYLGGGTTPIQVHAVAQSSATMSDPLTGEYVTPQGNLAAYAVSGQSGIGFSKSFVEHGHVLGLVSVRGDYTYQQGIDRMWSRQTKFDFYWPAFAHLGEVGILNKELYYQNDSSVDDQVFGYQERWYDYRYGISKITGKLRTLDNDNQLSYWHLAQFFSNLPTLNSTFIEESPPVDRVIAVRDEPHFIFDSVIKCRMARCMPVYSTPGLVDHF